MCVIFSLMSQRVVYCIRLLCANCLLPSPQLLYTGDFSRQEDRHLMAAEIPSVKPDILITVSLI